jgi:RanBP1 domain
MQDNADGSAGTWSFGGGGDVKLLYGSRTTRTRIVMQDSGPTRKVLLNHYVQHDAGAELRPAPSEADDRRRAFAFTAMDSSGGAAQGPVKKTFALRFKAESAASEFEKEYKIAQDRNKQAQLERQRQKAAQAQGGQSNANSSSASYPGSSASDSTGAAATPVKGGPSEATGGSNLPVVFGVSAGPLPAISETQAMTPSGAADSTSGSTSGAGMMNGGSSSVERSAATPAAVDDRTNTSSFSETNTTSGSAAVQEPAPTTAATKEAPASPISPVRAAPVAAPAPAPAPAPAAASPVRPAVVAAPAPAPAVAAPAPAPAAVVAAPAPAPQQQKLLLLRLLLPSLPLPLPQLLSSLRLRRLQRHPRSLPLLLQLAVLPLVWVRVSLVPCQPPLLLLLLLLWTLPLL